MSNIDSLALYNAIKGQAPVLGVSSAGVVQFDPSATPSQIATANATIASLITSDQPRPVDPTETNAKAIIAALNAGTATNAQLQKAVAFLIKRAAP